MTPWVPQAIQFINGLAAGWWRFVVYGGCQGAIVATVILLIVRGRPCWQSSLRYGLLLIALFKFLTPPLLTSRVGVFSQLPWTVSIPADSNLQFRLHETREAVPNHVETHPVPPVALLVDEPIPQALSVTAWMMFLYLLGAIFLFGLLVRQWIALRNLARGSQLCLFDGPVTWLSNRSVQLGLKQSVRLQVSDVVDSPICFGLWRPVVVLPSSVLQLSRQDIETVLVHELAHIRRGDSWMTCLQVLTCIVWWFHPLAWVLAATLRQVREECCDDVLLASGVASRDSYCDTLLRIAAQINRHPARLACAMAERLHPLATRLRRILDERQQPSERLSLRANFGLTTLAIFVLPGLNCAESPSEAATKLSVIPIPSQIQPIHSVTQPERQDVSVPSPSDTPDRVDLSGTWLMRLPKSFEYRVRWVRVAEGRFQLIARGLAFQGTYRWQGKSLVIDEPSDPQMNDLAWVADGNDRLRLIEPQLARNGGRYRGTLLTKRQDQTVRPSENVAVTQPDGLRSAKSPEPAGLWRLSLPSGFQHDVTLVWIAEGHYQLRPGNLVMSGIYQLRDQQLVLTDPGRKKSAGFVWTLAEGDEWILTSQPPLGATGSDSLGATLTR